MTWWKLRRLLFGDRRRADRVVDEARSALRRLDQALTQVELATVEADDERRRRADER